MTSKTEAARKLVEIMAQAGADGGRGRRDLAALPLADHVAEWEQSILNGGKSAVHAALQRRRVETITDGLKWTKVRNVDPADAARFIVNMRVKRGKNKRDWTPSIRTCNGYRQALGQFLRWLAETNRGPAFKLSALKLADDRRDRRRERRALEPDEARRLIAAATADDAQDVQGLTGEQRARLYRISLETGIRPGELSRLTWPAFRLDGKAPSVTLAASITKSGNS